MMKIACICSNAVQITEHTKKGTEIFVKILLTHLVQEARDLEMVAFASSDSTLPVPIESLGLPASGTDSTIPREKYIIFELALIAKAFAKQSEFDLYHINIGDGDIVLPFAQYVTNPILITIHNIFNLEYSRRYFALFKHLPNVSFIAASNAQKKLLPDLPYAGTIYHGIEEQEFGFGEGGESMMWAGRGIPHKGLDIALVAARAVKRRLHVRVIRKHEHLSWLDKILEDTHMLRENDLLEVIFDVKREDLILEYQKSKVFLFPIQWEEPFGLVLIESMACGTPVIAFARGAAPEIIIDGETGFLVNPSATDIRGDFIIQKTGTEGMIEAIERIYAMPSDAYQSMRRAARKRVEEHFNATRMAQEYAALYRKIGNQSQG